MLYINKEEPVQRVIDVIHDSITLNCKITNIVIENNKIRIFYIIDDTIEHSMLFDIPQEWLQWGVQHTKFIEESKNKVFDPDDGDTNIPIIPEDNTFNENER